MKASGPVVVVTERWSHVVSRLTSLAPQPPGDIHGRIGSVLQTVRTWWRLRRPVEPSPFRIPSDVDFETGFRQTVIDAIYALPPRAIYAPDSQPRGVLGRPQGASSRPDATAQALRELAY